MALQLKDTINFHAEAQNLRSRPADCNIFEETIKEQKAQLTRLTAVADELNGRMEQLAQEKDKAIAEIDALRRNPPPQVAIPDCTKLQQTVDRLQREIDNLQANPDCGKVQKVADKLKLQTETLEAELEKLRNQMGDCGNLKNDMERLQKEYQRVKNEGHELWNTNEDLRTEIDNLKKQHNHPPQVANPDYDDAKRMVEELKAELAHLRANPDCREILEKFEAEIANLRKNPDCTKVEELVKQLRTDVETQNEKYVELLQNFQKTSRNFLDLNEQFVSGKKNYLELTEQFKKKSAELDELRNRTPPQVAVPDCSDVIAKLNDAQRLIEQLQLENTPKDCDAEKQQINELTEALNTQTGKLQDVSIQNERLEAKLREKVPANCDEYISQITNLQRVIEQTVEENRRTVNDLRETQEQRIQAEAGRADQIQSALDNLKNAHRELQEKIPEMDRDLPQKHETLRVEYDELLREFKELQQKAAKQEEFLLLAQKRFEEMQREGEAIAQENSNFHEEIRTLKNQNQKGQEVYNFVVQEVRVLGENRTYLLEKLSKLIPECKSGLEAQQLFEEVQYTNNQANEAYNNLEREIQRVISMYR